jgi:ABC-type antimicrobial peptide transport system permease subunit
VRWRFYAPLSPRLCLGVPVFPRYNSSLLNRLVLHQFRKAPRPTCLSVLAIGVEVMLILTLVGIRHKELPPELKFIEAVISLLLLVAVAASFIYVIVARYAAVLERTQEIGIFRFLGASSAYIFSLLFQESLLFAISGTTVGIAMAYGIKWFMNDVLAGILTQVTVYEWWPIAGVISVVSDLLGAIVASRKAVSQDVIHALSHEQTDTN